MSDSAELRGQLPLFHIVGFTGHRQLRDVEGVAAALDAALAFLKTQVRGQWLALSSVAAGSDQQFVASVFRAGLSWHAILPFPPAQFADDFEPGEWSDVLKLIGRAEHVQVSSESGNREDAYLDCGMETVNGADLLLAVWDGEPARGRGGTAEVIEYARTVGKPIVIIDAATLERRVENWEALDPREATLTSLNALPAATISWAENPFQAPDEVFAFQQKCDHAANVTAPGVRRMTASTVMLHVLATFIAAGSLAFGLHLAALAWAKLLCLGAGLLAALVLHRRMHSERSWVKCRLAAEFCRSALATWGLPRATHLLQDLDLPVFHHLARSLRILHARAASVRPVPLEDFRRIYREKRIEDQLAYYRRQEGRALPQLRSLRRWFWIATLLAMLCVATYATTLTFEVHATPWLQRIVFDFLPIVLPVAAAATISIISIHDLRRRVARYRDMQAMLEASRAQIAYCATWSSFERVVLRTERALLQEVVEWHSLASFSESH